MNDLLNISIDDVEATESIGVTESVSKKNNTFNIKNYLNTKLADGESNRKTQIRILPISDEDSKPFKEVFMHNIKVKQEINQSGYKSYICLEQTSDDNLKSFGKKCPFCELRREAYRLSLEAEKDGKLEESKAYKRVSVSNIPKPAAILRCIERGYEKDGPKFWKINIRQDKSDAYNTILNLHDLHYKNYKTYDLDAPINLFDLHNGLDLMLDFEGTIDKNDNKKKISCKINAKRKQTPLSESLDEMKGWVYDKKKWSEVFPAKPYEYMALVLEGKIPWFDNRNNIWVDKDELFKTNEESNSKLSVENDNISEIDASFKSETKEVGIISDVMVDDLPF